MPQFQRQPIAAAQPRRNYFKEMLNEQEKKVDKDRLAEALSVIAGRPLDRSNETWIQKSLRGNRKVISTQQDAMDVLRDLQPSIWSDTKTRQAKLVENEKKRGEEQSAKLRTAMGNAKSFLENILNTAIGIEDDAERKQYLIGAEKGAVRQVDPDGSLNAHQFIGVKDDDYSIKSLRDDLSVLGGIKAPEGKPQIIDKHQITTDETGMATATPIPGFTPDVPELSQTMVEGVDASGNFGRSAQNARPGQAADGDAVGARCGHDQFPGES